MKSMTVMSKSMVPNFSPSTPKSELVLYNVVMVEGFSSTNDTLEKQFQPAG